MVTEATPIAKTDEAPMAVSAESAAETAPFSASSAFLGHTAQPDQAPTPTQMAAISPTPTNTPTKLDYGWLSETILRRVEELKRYPASARVDRAEGKVVVKAVINEDGSIGEVEVFQSSGHPGLDKAAIETLRQAAPFHLPRPLGQPRMTIKIPMSYRLDR
jgi:protein TonB